MLKLAYFREAMQLDASHVTYEIVQNNCRNGLQFERSIFARHTVYTIKHCFSYVSHVRSNSLLIVVVCSFNDLNTVYETA